MDKPITFNEWLGTQGNMVLLHANCCRIAFEGGQQSMQAKVEGLKASHHGEVIGHEVHFKKIKQERDELQTLYTQQGINMLKLQKRVDELQTAFKQLIEMENESISFEHDLFDKGWNQSARQTIENIYKLTGLGEQALKGEG
ncbi:hypothetical protein [Acinetobacter baumannii]|uniref:hypothetical protein n=1 Tax=Acinetobacter baumannii TaxID=470 RepID=UPI0038926537